MPHWQTGFPDSGERPGKIEVTLLNLQAGVGYNSVCDGCHSDPLGYQWSGHAPMVQFSAESCELVRKIRDSGISVFMIEHLMQAIMSLSDRVVVLNLGRKLAEGRPDGIAHDSNVIEAYLGFPDIVDRLMAARS